MQFKNYLYIALRQTSIMEVINAWCQKGGLSSCYRNPPRSRYAAGLQDVFTKYSLDEALYLVETVTQSCEKDPYLKGKGIFGAIVMSVKDYLIADNHHTCICKYSSLEKYRLLTHKIGPSVFNTAFLAYHDIKTGHRRTSFSIPFIPTTDNRRLYSILNKGMAENHFHIGGSSNAFLSSWVCMMNHMSKSRHKEFSKNNFDDSPLDDIDNFSKQKESTYSLVFKAAYIRLFLFYRLQGSYLILNTVEKDQANDVIAPQKKAEDLLKNVLSFSEEECHTMAEPFDDHVASLREAIQAPIYDYAIPTRLTKSELEHPQSPQKHTDRIYLYLKGEHFFLYQMFHALFLNDPEITRYADLFYAYLLIGCKIRGELIQTNSRIGFRNFLLYQDRKEIFTEHWKHYDRVRTVAALQDVLCDSRIHSLEGRFIPKNSIGKTKEKLSYFANCATQALPDDMKTAILDKLHYVVHFAKTAYIPKNPENPSNYSYELLQPRHSALRKIVQKQCDVLLQFRECEPLSASRIRGIDGCSNEIGCRAEVFGNVFRKIDWHYYTLEELKISTSCKMHKTYHVGEDFLSIIDGLRAVSDAIDFLNLESGDRLGHALVLGIDVEQWYASRKNIIILPQQDLIDNLVWLFETMMDFGMSTIAIESEVRKVFYDLFPKIYQQFIHSIDIRQYYLSMKLRGDDPELYREYSQQDTFHHRFMNEIRMNPWKLPSFRANIENPISWHAELYYYYHYNPHCKFEGAKPIEYVVPNTIIKAAAELQKRMQYEIAHRHICIECNPTSNTIIGNLQYSEHPIIRFYDNELFNDPDNPQICVSINTDDAGIFETSLENEYALLACAIESQHDLPDRYIAPDKIYRWLDHVREMGLEQSFLDYTHKHT